MLARDVKVADAAVTEIKGNKSIIMLEGLG